MTIGVVDVPLAEGGSVLVQVEPAVDGPVVRGAGGPAPVQLASRSFEDMLTGLGPVTRAVLSELRSATEGPSEIELEFAVTLTGEAKILLARAAGEAHFRITVRWPHPSDGPAPGASDPP
jgi:hypothetical protein